MRNVHFSSNKASDTDIIVRYFKNVFRASLDSSLQRCRFSFWSIVCGFCEFSHPTLKRYNDRIQNSTKMLLYRRRIIKDCYLLQ